MEAVLKRSERLQFFRELHFIEAHQSARTQSHAHSLQFFRELHFIEASNGQQTLPSPLKLQFFRELHFIEARCVQILGRRRP